MEKNLSRENETKGIKVMLIFEIVGKPPEHLTEALEGIIKQIDEEKGVSVKTKKLNEPVLMKDQKEFYTTFAEVEVEVEEIANLAILMFKYMPAHVEVLEPELIALTNGGWSDIFSELTRRLHSYDEVTRVLQVQNNQMKKKLDELMPSEEKPEEIKSENKEDKKE